MNKKVLLVVFLQLVFFQLANGETNGYLSFEYSRDLGDSEKKSDSFQNIQLGLIFSGSPSLGIGYLAELRLSEGKIEAEQAWIRFFSSESFRLKLGLYLVPFGKYNLYGRPHETFLIHAPLNVAHSYPSSWRDIGILIEGRMGSIMYAVFAGNGLSEGMNLNLGQQFIDNNKNKGIGGRLSWFLSQSLEVAYSYYRGKADSENQRNIVLKCIDVTWSTQGFKLMGEYTRGDLENPGGFSKGNTDGYFVQASLPLQKIHPVVSYQKFNYSDTFHGQGFVSPLVPGIGIHLNQSRWAFGVVFVPSPNVLLKLEYDLDKDESIDQKKAAITLQAALSF
ncbi:MAG: porin [Candidatus Aminicenantes bacterium]|nr:porin [Candidatus Aminicenantes bacterium]